MVWGGGGGERSLIFKVHSADSLFQAHTFISEENGGKMQPNEPERVLNSDIRRKMSSYNYSNLLWLIKKEKKMKQKTKAVFLFFLVRWILRV